MKSFPWKEFLQKHSIFATVRDEKRLDALLDGEVSTEHVYDRDQVILQQGELGDSVFVLGSGSAEAVLELDGGATVPLSLMRRGEVFGEMALLEHRARSATVRAKEPSTVLEIRGRDFEELMADFPDIEFKLLLRMSERLRSAGTQVVGLQASTVEDRLRVFGLKLDTEHKLVEAQVRAAQAIFDNTKLRADEVIISAERSRDRLQKLGAVVGAFATVVLGLLGAFGFKQIWDISQTSREVRTLAGEVEERHGEVSDKHREVIPKLAAIEQAHAEVERIQPILGEMTEQFIGIARDSFAVAVDGGRMAEALREYRRLRALTDDPGEVLTAVDLLEIGAFGDPAGPGRTETRAPDPTVTLQLLDVVAEDAQAIDDRAVTVRAYFLRLAYSIVTGQETRSARQPLLTRLAEEIRKDPEARIDPGKLPPSVWERIARPRGDRARAAELLELRRLATGAERDGPA